MYLGEDYFAFDEGMTRPNPERMSQLYGVDLGRDLRRTLQSLALQKLWQDDCGRESLDLQALALNAAEFASEKEKLEVCETIVFRWHVV